MLRLGAVTGTSQREAEKKFNFADPHFVERLLDYHVLICEAIKMKHDKEPK